MQISKLQNYLEVYVYGELFIAVVDAPINIKVLILVSFSLMKCFFYSPGKPDDINSELNRQTSDGAKDGATRGYP